MEYVLFFLEILFYTLGAIVICGLVVGLCEKLVLFLMGRGFGNAVVMGTSIIGTPVHELSHALMCLLFGHKITEIALWRPFNNDGTLGYVTHTYNPKNIYHQFGNLFIGVGPVLGGLGVMLLCLFLCFPETLHRYVSSATDMVAAEKGIGPVLLEGLKIIPGMFTEWSDGARPVWARILAVVVMFSVSLHINLSLADIKGVLTAIPMYLVLVLIATVISSLIGDVAMSAVRDALQIFNATMFALFAVVFVFVVLQILLALAVFLIRKLLKLK